MLDTIPSQVIPIIIQISFVVMIIASFVISVLFILSQQKLVNNIAKANNTTNKIHGAWLWTQLIPIWTYIALAITAVKLDEQCKAYEAKYTIKLKFKAPFVYWYIGMTILNLVPILNIVTTIVSLVLFIVVWSNISNTTKELVKNL
ncbi:hypothetical membrane protein [Francisella cf. novicida Fx1]|uniref:hypothetical protein n=1 Tax=Francisella tularensis TaxID=263 RepID=UPI00020591D3|nr:hypothetical protein [Francisella tularensis]AEB27822.1 hypothetical membrane protein [Francisella cf. novicida Fx1]